MFVLFKKNNLEWSFWRQNTDVMHIGTAEKYTDSAMIEQAIDEYLNISSRRIL